MVRPRDRPEDRVPDIFDEVEEDLRAERARALLQRYGFWLIAAAVLVVVGAGGYEFWQYRSRQSREQDAALFISATQTAQPTPGGLPEAKRKEALAGFARVADQGSEGYRTLARLRAAALKADGGDLSGANALWDEVTADSQADRLLRDLATLQWAQHQPPTADADAIRSRLGPLTAPTNPWRYLAEEQEALLDLRAGAPDRGKQELQNLAKDITAPEGVRGRANGLLERLGG
jgi:hypothetical protein